MFSNEQLRELLNEINENGEMDIDSNLKKIFYNNCKDLFYHTKPKREQFKSFTNVIYAKDLKLSELGKQKLRELQ